MSKIQAVVVDPIIAIEAPWTDVGAIAQQLLDRQFIGKAVLHLGK